MSGGRCREAVDHILDRRYPDGVQAPRGVIGSGRCQEARRALRADEGDIGDGFRLAEAVQRSAGYALRDPGALTATDLGGRPAGFGLGLMIRRGRVALL